MLLKSGQADSAKLFYDDVAGDSKGNLRALLGLGRVALAKRDWQTAGDIAKRLVRKDSMDISTRYLSAVAFRELGASHVPGMWASSRDDFEWILARDSLFEDVLYQYALLKRYEGERDGAFHLGELQLRLKPNLTAAQVGLYKMFRYFMAVEDSARFLEWLATQPGDLPRYFFGETLRRHGDLAGAERIFRGLLAHPGTVSPQAIYLSLARIRFRQSEPEGAEREYWNAVDHLDTQLGAEILFDDLKYVISDRELADYRRLHTVSALRDFFRSFWNFRNPSLASKTNARLQEHIRRFVVAEQYYEYYGFRTGQNNPDYLHELKFPESFGLNEEFNDKGLIYIRHGEPDDILRIMDSPMDADDDLHRVQFLNTPNASQEEKAEAEDIMRRYYAGLFKNDPCESWLYNPNQDHPKMIFHFQMHTAGSNNWRLYALPTNQALVSDLRLWDAKYQRLVNKDDFDHTSVEDEIKEESKEVVDYGLKTENNTWPKKTEKFSFPHAIDVFRAPDGRSLVDVSYAIPLARLAHAVLDTTHSLPVEIGLSMIDSHSRKSASELDTIHLNLSRSSNGFIVNLFRYTVPPDSYAVSMHIRPLVADMMGTWRRTLRVADFSGKGFMMSSIQLVRPSIDKSGVIIDGVKVIQSPFPTQMRSDPLYVYFQIYNLVPDADGNTSFETECILLPRDRSDLADGKVIYQKEKTGKETTSAEFYAIDIHSVDPGVYRLIVRVTDRKRVQAVSAERTLDILSP